jgi:hypothetical protein
MLARDSVNLTEGLELAKSGCCRAVSEVEEGSRSEGWRPIFKAGQARCISTLLKCANLCSDGFNWEIATGGVCRYRKYRRKMCYWCMYGRPMLAGHLSFNVRQMQFRPECSEVNSEFHWCCQSSLCGSASKESKVGDTELLY